MWVDVSGAIDHVVAAVLEAKTASIENTQPYFDIVGQTGLRNRLLYNALGRVNVPTTILEIGPWKGASTASLLYGNEANTSLYTVDNWSESGGSEENLLTTLPVDYSKLTLFSRNWANVNMFELTPYDIFVFDADDFRGCFEKYIEKLADISIVVVDDWNWPSLQASVNEAFTNTGVGVVHSELVVTDFNDKPEENFWNGVGVFVLVRGGVGAGAGADSVEIVNEPAPAAPEPVAEPAPAAPEPAPAAPEPTSEPAPSAPEPAAPDSTVDSGNGGEGGEGGEGGDAGVVLG